MTQTAPAHHCHNTLVSARDTDPVVLTRLFEDDTGAVCWTRPVNPAIVHFLNGILGTPLNIKSSGTPAELADSLDTLPDLPGRQALAEDVHLISDMFGVLTGATTLGLRLSLVSKPMCPRWHTDRVMVRMIASYGAAGTQWHHERIFTSETVIEQAGDHDILLLKGDLWQHNKTIPGIQHRYPPGQQHRLLLTLDLL